MPLEPVDWKDYNPRTGQGDPSTPITAARMNEMQAFVQQEADRAEAAAASAASRRTEDTARRQAWLMGKFLRKLAYHEPVTIACMGDSTTYGYDLVSADKVAAPTGTLPDGTAYPSNFTRSPQPWPSVLQTRLNEAFRSTITVLNRGFPGDTATLAVQHWVATSGADLTTIMFGINDNNYVGDPQVFIEDYERLILREVNDYNAAVVILTPVKQLATAAGRPGIEVYRNMLDALAAKYGVPIIDVEPFLAGYDNRTHSDTLHLNTFGNNIIGTRLASIFIGRGPANPFPVMHGSKLSVRPYLDNFVQSDANTGVQFTAGVDFTPSDGSADGVGGIELRFGGGPSTGIVVYSFHTETPDLVVVPQFHVEANAAITIDLDWNIEQGDSVNDHMVMDTPSLTTRLSGRIQRISGGAAITQNGHATGVNVIRIANPGWHTLKVWGGASASTAKSYLRGLQFMDYTSLRVAQQLGL